MSTYGEARRAEWVGVILSMALAFAACIAHGPPCQVPVAPACDIGLPPTLRRYHAEHGADGGVYLTRDNAAIQAERESLLLDWRSESAACLGFTQQADGGWLRR